MLRLLLGVAVASGTLISPFTVMAQSDWSAPVDGVRGRLVVTPSNSAGTPQFKLELDLENVSAEASLIEIWWTPLNAALDLSVVDEAGKPVPPVAPPGHGLQPGPVWLPLMHQSSVRVVRAKVGGEGGIRTHVPVTRQIAFEAIPLRPLRYLSARENQLLQRTTSPLDRRFERAPTLNLNRRRWQ
jgi:hypothetical protein